MTAPLSRARTQILRVCASAAQLSLALDFDGTLVPIQRDPHDPRLSRAQQRVLAQLAAMPGVTLSIISGRQVHDVESRVGVRRAYYAGNHGLEIRVGGQWCVRPAVRWARVIRRAARDLRGLARQMPRLLVEEKGPVLAVHYRNVPRTRWRAVRAQVRRIFRRYTHSGAMRIQEGKAVIELRPRSRHHKGWAVQWIRARRGGTARAATVLAIGDDATDEDLFRSVRPPGVSIHVGRGSTIAHYRTVAPSMVWTLLTSMITLRKAVRKEGCVTRR
ncbi:MAG: trehalose-phosphatase [Deltaproteobacteria bacterium]|nr:trehalose-phosphatase [Deltaproteobacteria bacterium]